MSESGVARGRVGRHRPTAHDGPPHRIGRSGRGSGTAWTISPPATACRRTRCRRLPRPAMGTCGLAPSMAWSATTASPSGSSTGATRPASRKISSCPCSRTTTGSCGALQAACMVLGMDIGSSRRWRTRRCRSLPTSPVRQHGPASSDSIVPGKAPLILSPSPLVAAIAMARCGCSTRTGSSGFTTAALTSTPVRNGSKPGSSEQCSATARARSGSAPMRMVSIG